ncbi:MAG TPA: hypothetical protein VGS79_19035 [Puia sp.]|nr:hypothetical protein [Puia sp.]
MMYTDKILNTAYSFAAAIVVFGAWAKLEQKEFGGLALTIGMLVESGIFVIYGLVEWREQRQPAASETPATTATTVANETTGVKPLDADRIDELQQTVEKTHGMLKKIFRTEA